MLRWLIGIILGKIISKSSNWQHIQRLKITILGQIGNFLDWKGCQMFIFYFVYTQHQVLLICDENIEISVANDTIEVYLLLGINIWGLRSEWVNQTGLVLLVIW